MARWASQVSLKNQAVSCWAVVVPHTGLDDVNSDVVEAGVYLLRQKRRRHRVDVVDAQGVLCRQRRRRRHGIAAMGGDDLLVCLEAAARFFTCERYDLALVVSDG